MSLEGRVSIEVYRHSTDRTDGPSVHVTFTQPGRIDRLLRGKTPAQAMQIVPSIFSLCAMAQSHAAQGALDAAIGTDVLASPVLTARQCLTEMECLRENALRIAMDWPRFIDEPVDTRPLKRLMRLLPALSAALPEMSAAQIIRDRALDAIAEAESLLQEFIFAEPLAVWQERDNTDAVRQWAATAPTCAARMLARVAKAGWQDAGTSPVIPLQPLDAKSMLDWLLATDKASSSLPFLTHSHTPETTLLARHVNDHRLAAPHTQINPERGLWDRLVGRLIELSALPGRIRRLIDGETCPNGARMLAPGTGLAEVNAARGVLAHVASVHEGCIIDYRILPPTRWNFDANGIAARALRHVAEVYTKDQPLLSELVVNAIDPCVGHTLRIN